MAGVFYVVPTPIGNLLDITLRAIDVLKSVDVILAEDTRHSHRLLSHYDIKTTVISLHDHNEKQMSEKIVEKLVAGNNVALISDAGTPLISDPGYHMIRVLHAEGIKIHPLPGACAAITALCASGLPTDRFSFEGFLPAKSQARKETLENLRGAPQTLIFYEAPHRIKECLESVRDIYGDTRTVVMARELTKVYETLLSGSASELLTIVTNDPNQEKGEIVLLIEGNKNPSEDYDIKRILMILLDELPLKRAVVLAAKISGEKKNTVYDLALEIQAKRTIEK